MRGKFDCERASRSDLSARVPGSSLPCHARLLARAQFRRHAMKLRFWKRGDDPIADLECVQIPDSALFVAKISDGFGLAEGFNVVFCEEPAPLLGGTLCVLCVMQADEPFSAAMLEILRGREAVARERLRNLA